MRESWGKQLIVPRELSWKNNEFLRPTVWVKLEVSFEKEHEKVVLLSENLYYHLIWSKCISAMENLCTIYSCRDFISLKI